MKNLNITKGEWNVADYYVPDTGELALGVWCQDDICWRRWWMPTYKSNTYTVNLKKREPEMRF